MNDIYGHLVGDTVIRTVARALREIIRADDLMFRWGGDEFFVIMISLDADMAYGRMEQMDRLLSDVQIEGVEHPITINVSHAFENFSDLSALEAIPTERERATRTARGNRG